MSAEFGRQRTHRGRVEGACHDDGERAALPDDTMLAEQDLAGLRGVPDHGQDHARGRPGRLPGGVDQPDARLDGLLAAFR